MARQKTYAGGNLFAIAAAELGDARQWNRLAAANGMWDPFFTGLVTLTIPDAIPGLQSINPLLGGGVLGAPG